jgi:hypothetical protein
MPEMIRKTKGILREFKDKVHCCAEKGEQLEQRKRRKALDNRLDIISHKAHSVSRSAK